MCAHTDHTKHTLSLDKMLGEKKIHLNKKEWDLASLSSRSAWMRLRWDTSLRPGS
jgi:hypothetical protein